MTWKQRYKISFLTTKSYTEKLEVKPVATFFSLVWYLRVRRDAYPQKGPR